MEGLFLHGSKTPTFRMLCRIAKYFCQTYNVSQSPQQESYLTERKYAEVYSTCIFLICIDLHEGAGVCCRQTLYSFTCTFNDYRRISLLCVIHACPHPHRSSSESHSLRVVTRQHKTQDSPCGTLKWRNTHGRRKRGYPGDLTPQLFMWRGY